jgi:hypothetical protein
VRPRQLQASIREGLHSDVRGNRCLAVAGRKRRDRIGMAEGHGQMVEAMRVVPQLLGRHLQHDGIERQAHRRHGDAIMFAEIGQALDVGVDGIKGHGAVADGTNRLDFVGAAARLFP